MDNSDKKTDFSLEQIVKAVYKSVLKTMRDKKRKEEAQSITQDILDPNYVAEVNPENLPPTKSSVMNKSRGKSKSAKPQEKGVAKLNKYLKKRCQKE